MTVRIARPDGRGVSHLLEIMARLRDREGGCPWDVEQSFESIAPYTLEEAYEVEEAIASGDRSALCDELGDLLLQVVFHARMAEEEGSFHFDDVVEAICDKLVRRHPHVFGDARIESAEAQTQAWEAMKREEREAAAGHANDPFHAVPRALPALARARKLQKRAPAPAAARGLSPGEARDALAQLAAGRGDGQTLGRLLFNCVRWASEAGLDAETALREACHDFEARARGEAGR